MKKVGNILILLAGIFTIVGAVGVLIGSIVLFALTSPSATQTIINGIKDGTIQSDLPGTPEEVAAALQASFAVIAVVLLIITFVEVGCAVLAFLARKKQTQGLYIANLVIGILGGSLFSIIGAILCIADNSETAK